MIDRYRYLVNRLRTLSDYSSVTFNDRVERGDCKDAADAIECLVMEVEKWRNNSDNGDVQIADLAAEIERFRDEIFLMVQHNRKLEDALKNGRFFPGALPEKTTDTGALKGITDLAREIRFAQK